jgi:hypothetical protein
VHEAQRALRAATRYYERHVIAWHALGRHDEARGARDAVARHRQQLAADPNLSVNGIANRDVQAVNDICEAGDVTATTLVALRLDLATETISGTLTTAAQAKQPFWGWLELSEALDELRLHPDTNSARGDG